MIHSHQRSRRVETVFPQATAYFKPTNSVDIVRRDVWSESQDVFAAVGVFTEALATIPPTDEGVSSALFTEALFPEALVAHVKVIALSMHDGRRTKAHPAFRKRVYVV